MFHKMIDDNRYIGMLTVLDYELSLRKCLAEISFPPERCTKRKIIVDLALKCGINEYRFVSFDISDTGKILWSSDEYITPQSNLTNVANSYFKEKSEIVKNSMLSKSSKIEVLSYINYYV